MSFKRAIKDLLLNGVHSDWPIICYAVDEELTKWNPNEPGSLCNNQK